MTAIALPVVPAAPPLVRRRRAAVAGVAGGLADHLGWRVGPTRALFVVGAAAAGLGPLLYAWLWLFAPLEPGERRISRRLPVAGLLLAGSVILPVLAAPLALQDLRAGYGSPVIVLPLHLAVLLAIGGGLWAALVDRVDPLRGPRHDIAERAIATVVLAGAILVAIVLPVSTAGSFLMALLPLVGIAVVWSSTWVQRFRELQQARVASIRDEQRAEMAAHLHDSVLQTLALIQNRAGASSEAGRLARAQERELRAWLYDGDAPADGDLATDLRDYASALELDFPVTVTVVATGSSAERASGEVAAATREAMLNAARHASGEISVYVEGSDDAVEVFVRDRGPGFDLDDVPPDRLGVRESILGRMRRAGGSAAVTRGTGGGTEIRIRYPAREAARG